MASVVMRTTKSKGDRWYAVISLGGNKKQWILLEGVGNQGDAEREAKRQDKRLNKMEPQERAAASKKRFKSAWAEFRASHVAKLRENTRQDYDYSYAKHISKALFAIKMVSNVTVKDIEAYIALKEPDLSHHTIHNQLGMLRSFFRWSQDRDYCASNPAKAMGLRFPVHDSRVYLTPEQAQLFGACMATEGLKAEAIAAVGLWCGLRWGEIRGLGWDTVDIADPKNANLLVRRQVVFLPKSPGAPAGTTGGYHVVKVLKKEASYRQVGIPESVALLLRKWRRHKDCTTLASVVKAERVPEGLVFPAGRGGVMSDSNFSRNEFRRAKDMAKKLDPTFPDDATIHSMRHTFATSMLLAGMSMYDLRGQMGHGSVQTTAKYGHYVPEKRVLTTAPAMENSIRDEKQKNAALLKKIKKPAAAQATTSAGRAAASASATTNP